LRRRGSRTDVSEGRHPAGLDFGDLFAYALARTSGEPLLFTAEDFSEPDIGRVI
jgi:ribonuclease VapC